MVFTRKHVAKKGELSLQALEWLDFNEYETNDREDDDMDIDEEEESYYHKNSVENKENEKYLIRIFGATKEGDSVCLNVKNFTPFFFVKIGNNDPSKILNCLKRSLKNVKTKEYNSWKTHDYSSCFLDEACVVQNKHDFFGFTNKQTFKFLRLVFTNSNAMKKCISIIKNNNSDKKTVMGLPKLPLYEANLDSVIRFAHIRNLNFSGWLNIEEPVYSEPEFKVSSCQIEATLDWREVTHVEESSNAKLLQASYDIETYSIDGKFPSPEIDGNVITHIATTFKFFGEKEFLMKHIIVLKNCSDLDQGDDGVPKIMECYDTEEEVLLAWRNLIVRTDPDILYQYNGDQFDCNYLHKRSIKTGCSDDFLQGLGKLKYVNSSLKENNFSSSAYGSSNFKRLSMPGRINFDILIYIKREYKESSYKLDYVAEKYLGQNKNPVTAQMMFKYFEEGNPDNIKIVSEYCLVDTVLPQKLVDKLHILQNQISMSNVCSVPIRFLIERGQQIKVFSQILKETRRQNFLVPTIENAYDKVPSDDSDDEDSFTGATVLAPLKGAYFEPVTVCDFASLYPSIIRAHNLCFSTIVLDNNYDNMDGVEYKTFEWQDGDNLHCFKYSQSTEGILPKLLTELSTTRSDYKKLMKTTDDPFLVEVYNKCQLAVKVSMNSIYGFLAAPMLKCKPIAATVTSIGRGMIEETKKFMEDNYSASVAVYGDSVTGKTPLLLRDPISKKIVIKTIKELLDEENLIDYPGFKIDDSDSIREDKAYSKTSLQVWTDLGWNNIKKVIRHKTDKKIYRVLTGSGLVEVTEDHSLLNENCIVLKAKNCVENETRLLSSYPRVFHDENLGTNDTDNIDKIAGILYGSGISNYSIGPMSLLVNLLKNEYPQLNYSVKFCEKTTMFTLVGDRDFLMLKRSLDDYLNCDKTRISNFIEGYLCSFVDDKRVLVTSYTEGAKLYLLFKKLGYSIFIETSDKKEVYLNLHSSEIVDSNKIRKIEKTDHGTIFVYDLETELGRFNAGVGDIQVKNTDSVFIKFNTETTKKYKEAFKKYQESPSEENKKIMETYKSKCIKESMEVGKEAAINATKNLFINPVNLEYEKVYCPLLLLSKKRYIGDLYEKDEFKPKYRDNKGVVLKRRDNFELLKKIYSVVLDKVMAYGNSGVEQAKEYIEDCLAKIANNQYENLDDFVISKLLKDTYKNKNIPHLVLANKIRKRDPGNAPKSNDRVPYVFTYPNVDTKEGKKLIKDIQEEREKDFIEKVAKNYGKKIKDLEEAVKINKTMPKKVILKKTGKFAQYEKVEDPEYMIKHKLPLDAEYYITFMKTSVSEILALFMDNPEKIFDDVIDEYKRSNW